MRQASMVADEIQTRLRDVGTPERAEKKQRYLKSSLQHLGAPVGEMRRAARHAAKDLSSHDDVVELVEALWAKPVHECRATAAFLLNARAELLGAADIGHIERLVREARTWAIVDVLAGNVLGAVILRHPDAAEVVDPWARDPDFWIRRAALLSQLAPLKDGAPFERFAGYADAMLAEREFFIRKAIGWVLRETAKSRPHEVFEWLLPRAHRASRVTMREAIKYLPEHQQTAALDAAGEVS